VIEQELRAMQFHLMMSSRKVRDRFSDHDTFRIAIVTKITSFCDLDDYG
jgi:hypothetical protein